MAVKREKLIEIIRTDEHLNLSIPFNPNNPQPMSIIVVPSLTVKGGYDVFHEKVSSETAQNMLRESVSRIQGQLNVARHKGQQ